MYSPHWYISDFLTEDLIVDVTIHNLSIGKQSSKVWLLEVMSQAVSRSPESLVNAQFR